MGTFVKIAFAVIIIFIIFTIAPYFYFSSRKLIETFQLPATVFPQSYNITLRLYLLPTDAEKRFIFEGEVKISIIPNITTKRIVLHTKDLNYTVREFWLKSTPTAKTPLDFYEYDKYSQKVSYFLKSPLKANSTYVLHFVYTGRINHEMVGVYYSSYETVQNDTRIYVATHFEPHNARRCFPAFDEPNFKATFSLTLLRPRALKSISNMRKIKTVYFSDHAADIYDTTPKMSTYLLAFVVSDFKERFNGKIGVISRPILYDHTIFCQTAGKLLLDAFDSYFDVLYYHMGIDKMHIAALPECAVKAMENWGIIIVKEELVLHSGKESLKTQQDTVVLLAHEIAHMWFGNLVTCSAWNYVWLQEGFANYFQYHIFSTITEYSNFKTEDQFVIDEQQVAMAMDSENDVYALNKGDTVMTYTTHAIFDQLSYKKGGSLLRMVRHIIGEDDFKRALHMYLTKYAYTNVSPQDLLDCFMQYWPIETIAYADAFFASFSDQIGYPVVIIEVDEEFRSFEAKQKRFLLKPTEGSKTELQYTIPITYTTDKQKNFTYTIPEIFLEPDQNINVELDAEANWVIVNLQATGYYRIKYDNQNLLRIRHALHQQNWDDIHELNRAQLVDDLFNLARAGDIDYEHALKVLEYLETETHYLPWAAAFRGYTYLVIRLGTDTQHFAKYILEQTQKAYELRGFEEHSKDNPFDIYNRAEILEWSCKYGNTDCISMAQRYFQNQNNTAMPVNIRSAVYCTVMREGKEVEFYTLFEKYKRTLTRNKRMLILRALGCVKDPVLVQKYFWTVMGNNVPQQDKLTAITHLYTENNENVLPVFKLISTNVERVAQALGSYSKLATLLEGIAFHFTEHSQKLLLENFNLQYISMFGPSAINLGAAVTTVQEELRWSTENLTTLKQYLQNRTTSS